MTESIAKPRNSRTKKHFKKLLVYKTIDGAREAVQERPGQAHLWPDDNPRCQQR